MKRTAPIRTAPTLTAAILTAALALFAWACGSTIPKQPQSEADAPVSTRTAPPAVATPAPMPTDAARASRTAALALSDGKAAVRGPEAFASIEDPQARSVALFAEMGKILTHPRCMNCHPSGDRPLQTDRQRLHMPLVVRGDDNHGVPGMRCGTCHGEANFERVPGAPHWHLAPIEMAWVGRTLPQICAQLKDPARNGGKSSEEMHAHMAEDPLVAYGWNPPAHLEPAPGSQVLLGQLFRAWLDAGSHCPPDEETAAR